MQTSNNGLNLIKQFEGFRTKAYLCSAGVPTIGYGTTKYASGRPVKLGDVCTADQAIEFLKNDVKQFEQAVLKLVKVPLTQNQFDALVSFTYNLGAGALAKSTLLKLLNGGDYTGAADQFLKWNQAGGRVLQGLVKRREAERALFLR